MLNAISINSPSNPRIYEKKNETFCELAEMDKFKYHFASDSIKRFKYSLVFDVPILWQKCILVLDNTK